MYILIKAIDGKRRIAMLPRFHWEHVSVGCSSHDFRFHWRCQGLPLLLTVKVDSGGKWDWRRGGRWIDLEEIRTLVIFVRIKGSLLSLFVHVCACVCVCVYILLGYIRVPNVYMHFSDIRGETCYCVMISERFVASRCNPAGISTANDRCFFNALNFFPFFSIFFSFFPSPFKLSTNWSFSKILKLRICE